MKLLVEINLDNAAFEDNGNGTEAARILRKLAERVDEETLDESFEWPLMDTNGNRVGKATIQ